jgi:hypothetical protein
MQFAATIYFPKTERRSLPFAMQLLIAINKNDATQYSLTPNQAVLSSIILKYHTQKYEYKKTLN